jgi:hypothetical protein
MRSSVLCGVRSAGNGGERLAQLAQPIGRRSPSGRCGARSRRVRPAEPGPAALEPVGLVRQIGLGGLELAFEQLGELVDDAVDAGLVDHAFAHQPLAVERADRRVLPDLGIHERLGEARLVALIVAEAAVAPHVDDDVALEALAELHRHLGDEGDRLRIVAVDVEDRRLDHLGHVRRIGRGARELRRGGEADLVVDDEMDGAAGAVAGQAGKAEASRRRCPGRRRRRRRAAARAAPRSPSGVAARMVCTARALPSTTGFDRSRDGWGWAPARGGR